MRPDPAVLEVLSLSEGNVTVEDHGGGGGSSSASTSKIISKQDDGTKLEYFMKTGSGKDAEIMFQGEHASLNAINAVVPSLCPKSHGSGPFSSDANTFFLVTDFLNLSARSNLSADDEPASLAEKLAQLHTTPAPIPDGYDSPMFGFPVPTCCGDTPQDNTFNASWADFYANSRLRFILERAESANGVDDELRRMLETVASIVVPRLIGDEHLNGGRGVTPVVVHGDLWSGNAGRGRIGDDDVVQEVVYDPSACYAHSEYELGIMKMFGGFGDVFLREYHRACAKTEPVGEYEDRVELYGLYHHLNHYALFGGGYKAGAKAIMKRLIRTYVHDKA
ncbi:Ketosamine-3-kinase [Pseudovirgaria hyperparasitica]|uniref:protein-ribulosamine 3-kinase n=1 Tax=Pseudovirgaria hyperparasitica TaxID=470096 RepID=A0A6A6W5I5_9PEZI|nr:Ketosamine-3-kinase [Pseudovirgaria hyperparasitica]KAF2757429.1 Ketosamine-3-kinase [Pseudovirgaria hyperparasitica]